MPVQTQLKQILEGQSPLAQEQARALMEGVLLGEVDEDQLAAMLLALNKRGETAAEIAGFVQAMRAAAVQIPLSDTERGTLVDTCGTGGAKGSLLDGAGTFNISTAVALVAAAAGARVAKHGNRNVTSLCGSADVLDAMGIAIDQQSEQIADALRSFGFAFMLAPRMHPALKQVMPVRKKLGVRTVFNILGPLTNPAGASAQVMGVYSAHLVPLVAEAMALLHTRHAFVVHGSDGLDELTITGPSEVAEVRGSVVELKRIAPEDAGLEPAPLETLRGGDARANAEILNRIFSGERSPRRDVVLLNAAAVLMAAEIAANLHDGVRRAAEAIDSGAVVELVERLRG